MFFGSTSTIISIIFGLGLQWILFLAGQDLVHKLLHKSPNEPVVEIQNDRSQSSFNTESSVNYDIFFADWANKNVHLFSFCDLHFFLRPIHLVQPPGLASYSRRGPPLYS